MKTPMRFLALSLLPLLAACGDGDGAGGGFQRPPTPVEVAVAAVGPVTDRFATVGTLEADEAITVATEIDGIVVEVPFVEGSRLERGDLILRLDDRQLRAEAARAQALLDKSRATWQRVKTVADQGAGTPQDLDDALAAWKVAEADLALAQTRLAKTRVTAPFGGLVGARRVSPGAFLRAGQPITDLAQIDVLRATFAIPERLLGAMRRGAAVAVGTTAYPDVVLQGTIDVIEPQLDAGTRSAGVVARVDNSEGLLRPGMSAAIEVVLGRRESAVSVPSEAVFVEGGQAFVYVVGADSVVTRSPVELGSRLPDRVEVLGGLAGGQRVVQAGHQKLFEGAKVAPIGGGAEGGAER